MNSLSLDLLEQRNPLIIWNKFKKQANNNLEEMFKLALEIWSDNTSDLDKTASFSHRNAIANDIAMSSIVDLAIEKLAGVTEQERQELTKLNAELNVYLLKEALSPATIGALVGGGLGAAEGAYEHFSDDKPLATIAARAIPGAAIGGLVGKGYSELSDLKKSFNEEQAKKLLQTQSSIDANNAKALLDQAHMQATNAKAQQAALEHAERLKDLAAKSQQAGIEHAERLKGLASSNALAEQKLKQLTDAFNTRKAHHDVQVSGYLNRLQSIDPQLHDYLMTQKENIINTLAHMPNVNDSVILSVIKDFRQNMPKP